MGDKKQENIRAPAKVIMFFNMALTALPHKPRS